MSILNIIKGCPLFYELYDEEIMHIVEKCRVLNLQPDDVIFKDGDNGQEIYLILSGSAQVKKGTYSLANLRKGDLFGEMVLLKENTRNASVISDNYTDVLIINYSDIFDFYESNKKIFSILMLNLARLMSTRLKKAGEDIKELKIENQDLKSQLIQKAS